MDLYLAIVVIMLVLAVAGLVVGVSNDAVNFLNSALGSKAAPRYVIMTVASVGIIVGAITSSGMMEVARSGVFHPQMFTFAEVMLLFLAVTAMHFLSGGFLPLVFLPTTFWCRSLSKTRWSTCSIRWACRRRRPFRSCSACWARR